MFIPVATVFVITWLAYFFSLRLFRRIGLIDSPGRYGLSRPPIPYPTGIVAILVFIFSFLFFFRIGIKESGLILAVTIIGIVSFVDDLSPLPAWIRLTMQIGTGFLVFATGSQIYTITNPFGGVIPLDTVNFSFGPLGPLPLLSGLFTIGWLLFTINALNWLDGVSGQVSIVSTIGFVLLGCLALLRNGEPEIALMAFTLAAIAGAGAFFDFPPSKMLIGDTGSMFFGLMLGLLGIYHGGKVATVFLALGLPLIDAIIVTLRRISSGHSPLRGGEDHLHHRLKKKGWSPRLIVFVTAFIGLVFGSAALFVDTKEKVMLGMVLFVLVLGLRKL